MFYRSLNANILRVLVIVGTLGVLAFLSLPVSNMAFAQQQEMLRFEYDENGMEPVAVFTAVDPEGDEVSWMLNGDDAGDFNIDNGVLTFKSPPDFEMPMGGAGGNTNTYSVDVIATDGTTPDTQMVVVTVMNRDEPGIISLLTLQPQAGVTLTTSAIVDEDGDVTTGSEEWQWSSSSSMNGTYTDIEDDAEAMMYRPTTGDTGRYLKATVTYTDPEGAEKMAMAVSANPVKAAGVLADNNAPEFPDQDPATPGDQITTATRSIPENTAPGMSVGAPVAADDDDNNDVLTYSLSGDDASLFDIDPATGQIVVAAGAMLDYDANQSDRQRDLTVTVRDQFYDHDIAVDTDAQSQATIDVEVTITNVDEAPEFVATTGGATSLTFAEATTTPATDGGDNTYDANDPEGATVTYSLSGDDASKLQIDDTNGTLTFRSAPDYENPGDADQNNRYKVTVEASDATGMVGTRDVTAMVANVMEAGMVTLSTLQPQIGVAVMTEVTDLDGDVTGAKYQWHSNQGNAGQPCSTFTMGADNEIDDATQASYTPKDDDEVMCLAVVVNYTDGQGSDMASMVAANPVVPDATPRAPVFGDEDLETDGLQNTVAERSIAENTQGGTDNDADDVGDPVVATDPNGGVVTHTLSGADAGSFTINRETGQINVAAGAKLDREAKDTYNVVVTATDPSSMSSSIMVTIKLTNVPEGPEVVGDARFEYDENGMEPVAVFTAVDPEGDEVSWMLNGDDAGDFNIDNGVLTFKSPPDFEMPMGGAGGNTNTYSVDVIATDGTTPDTQMVVVTVMNRDEPGIISLLTLQPQAGVTLTTSAIVDEDGDVTTGSEEWQWSSSSSMNGTYTDIEDDAEAMMYRPTTGDTGRYLKATVTYTDPEGAEKMAMAVSANPVKAAGVLADNNAPEFPDQDPATPGDQITTATRSIPENTAPGMSVGAPVAADDDDNNDVLTYSLSGDDASLFDIDPATGQIVVAAGAMLDYDANQSDRQRDLTVTVRDQFYDHDIAVDTDAQSQATIDVEVTITNVDEAPEFVATTGGATSLTFAEATTTPATDGGDNTYDANDPEGATVTYSLSGDDASKLQIDDTNGTLTFRSAPDYENPGDADQNNRYKVTVEASDATGMVGTRDVTAMVTNVMEAGMVTLSTLQPTVGVAVMTEVTDLDGDVTGAKYQWHSNQGNAGQPCSTFTMGADNEIDDATQASYTPKDDDEVMCLAVVVNYTDGQGSDMASMVAANPVVPDATPRAPVFGDEDLETDGLQNTVAERSIAENTQGGTDNDADDVGDPVVATDPNGEVVTHTLSGADAGSFTINRETGQINVAAGAKLDREAKDTYNVVVTATDPRNMSSSIMVTIKLTNVPEGPTIMVGGLGIGGPSNIEHAENDTSMVAAYTAAGPDADMATWSLSGDDSGAFNIGGSTGELTFASAPDYENPTDADMDKAYMVTVMANDGTNEAMLMVTVTVTDETELGTLMGEASVDYEENGTDAVMTYTADGPVDASWSVGGDDMGAFTIGASSGELMFVSSPDFENSTAMGMDNMYMVTVMAAAGGEMGTMDVTVNVTNEEEPGTVALSNPSPLVDDVVMADLTDPDGSVTEMTWQWSRTMDMADGWTDIMGADMASYTATSDDDGHYLQATASYTDGEGADKSAMAMTANPVTAVADQDGTVSLSATEPQVGGEVTASLTDPDGSVTGMTWQWAKSMDGMTGWADISTATDAAYTPVEADDGYYLRATVSYTDGHGTGKSAMMVTDNAVTTGDPLVNRYDADNNGTIDKSEVIQAINDYLFDEGEEPITKTDVIRLINLYLFPGG